jgi:hypothetical protein
MVIILLDSISGLIACSRPKIHIYCAAGNSLPSPRRPPEIRYYPKHSYPHAVCMKRIPWRSGRATSIFRRACRGLRRCLSPLQSPPTLDIADQCDFEFELESPSLSSICHLPMKRSAKVIIPEKAGIRGIAEALWCSLAIPHRNWRKNSRLFTTLGMRNIF